jgi:hypothetical protein
LGHRSGYSNAMECYILAVLDNYSALNEEEKLMWQSRLKAKELTPYPKCQVQIDRKSHPELYAWLLRKSHETHHSMSAIVRAILYEAMELSEAKNRHEQGQLQLHSTD